MILHNRSDQEKNVLVNCIQQSHYFGCIAYQAPYWVKDQHPQLVINVKIV